MDFAIQVLQSGGTVEELRNYARRLEVQEQVREWQFITEELQEKKNIDWQGAPMVIEGELPILENPPFDVFLSVVEPQSLEKKLNFEFRSTTNHPNLFIELVCIYIQMIDDFLGMIL